jgi:hypothetical protein
MSSQASQPLQGEARGGGDNSSVDAALGPHVEPPLQPVVPAGAPVAAPEAAATARLLLEFCHPPVSPLTPDAGGDIAAIMQTLLSSAPAGRRSDALTGGGNKVADAHAALDSAARAMAAPGGEAFRRRVVPEQVAARLVEDTALYLKEDLHALGLAALQLDGSECCEPGCSRNAQVRCTCCAEETGVVRCARHDWLAHSRRSSAGRSCLQSGMLHKMRAEEFLHFGGEVVGARKGHGTLYDSEAMCAGIGASSDASGASSSARVGVPSAAAGTGAPSAAVGTGAPSAAAGTGAPSSSPDMGAAGIGAASFSSDASGASSSSARVGVPSAAVDTDAPSSSPDMGAASPVMGEGDDDDPDSEFERNAPCANGK